MRPEFTQISFQASICLSLSILSSISPDSPSSVLTVLFPLSLINYHPSITAAVVSQYTLSRTFISQDFEANYKVASLKRSIIGGLITAELDPSMLLSKKYVFIPFII